MFICCLPCLRTRAGWKGLSNELEESHFKGTGHHREQRETGLSWVQSCHLELLGKVRMHSKIPAVTSELRLQDTYMQRVTAVAEGPLTTGLHHWGFRQVCSWGCKEGASLPLVALLQPDSAEGLLSADSCWTGLDLFTEQVSDGLTEAWNHTIESGEWRGLLLCTQHECSEAIVKIAWCSGMIDDMEMEMRDMATEENIH